MLPQIARIARMEAESKMEDRGPKVEGSASAGEFDDAVDSDLESSIDASRELDRGDLVEAVARVRIAGPPRAGDKPSARYWISRRIAARLRDLKGEDFIRLANRLSE